MPSVPQSMSTGILVRSPRISGTPTIDGLAELCSGSSADLVGGLKRLSEIFFEIPNILDAHGESHQSI